MITKLLEYAKRYDMLPDSGIILACVSGGADSMALLTALLELAPVGGFTVEVAHFDHRLRGTESDRDREFVSEYCKNLVPCHIGYGDTRAYAEDHMLGIEEAARELRYTFFQKTADMCGTRRIATAHNANDNTETVLLNLTRGAGTRGLSGIPPTRGNIIRPLLCVSRTEIESFLNERDVPFIVDSTNLSDEYARNKIRLHVSPVLQSVNASYARHVLEAGDLLRRDDEYLTSLAESFLGAHGSSVPVSLLSALPEPVSARVLSSLAGSPLSFLHVGKVLDICRDKHGSKIIQTPRGVFLRSYDTLSFQESPLGKTFSPVDITPGADAEIPELNLKIRCREVDSGICSNKFYQKHQINSDTVNKSFKYFLFKKDNICGNIIVRPRIEGDYINIWSRGVSKSLKKLFIEEKITKWERGLVPVIADDNGPLAVYGICVGTRALPQSNEPAIKISFARIADA